jgi:dTDP-4-amino-4,6-dideoxygalactose transaminase
VVQIKEKILRNLSWIEGKLDPFLNPHKFSFHEGHSYLSDNEVKALQQIISDNDGSRNADIREDFERTFCQVMGGGKAASFASGRMAFHELLRYLDISPRDEILLPAFTCSVMANAVIRAGGVPRYYNIHPDTCGSDLSDIKTAVSERTKVVVVQHSFGIPCDIGQIQDYCLEKKIFLLEDSALSFDSSREGKKVGMWGDAAIFSFDRGKPLNAMTGGMLYSLNSEMIGGIAERTVSTCDLSRKHQLNLFHQFLIEKKYLYYHDYWKYSLADTTHALVSLLRNEPVFLTDDYSSRIKTGSEAKYPYPAKIPAFCARIGVYELNRWDTESKRRKEILRRYLEISEEEQSGITIPAAYHDSKNRIVPLRFAFSHPQAYNIIKRMNHYVETRAILFREPIVCCTDMAQFQYNQGMCPDSERICKNILNWPCIAGHLRHSLLIKKYRETLQYINQIQNKL